MGRDKYGDFTKLSEILVENGYNTFRFDFRVQGKSDGKDIKMTMEGLKKDNSIKEWIKQIKENVNKNIKLTYEQ